MYLKLNGTVLHASVPCTSRCKVYEHSFYVQNHRQFVYQIHLYMSEMRWIRLYPPIIMYGMNIKCYIPNEAIPPEIKF